MVDKANFQCYHYDPSIIASALFTVLFFLTTMWHTVQLFATRTWYLIPVVLGGILEITGYICRIIAHTETPNWSLAIYIMQSQTLLLAPTLFAASVYMALGRIMKSIHREQLSFIRVRLLTKVFVAGDMLSLLIQGAGIMSKKSNLGKDNMKTGTYIIIGGLVIQLFFFGFFIIVAGLFDHAARRKSQRNSTVFRL